MPFLNIQDYATDIDLFTPFAAQPARLSSAEREAIVDALLAELTHVTNQFSKVEAAQYAEKRRLLHAALNPLEPHFLQPNAIAKLDALLQAELAETPVTTAQALQAAASLTVNATKIALWQGDITTLAVDAIVNAANNRLLGCFQPLHSCIDNAIHTKAGVQLRDDCNVIMQKQNMPEPTGMAKLTRAYNLPSKFVLHTVGPIVKEQLTDQHVAELAQAYVSCLDTCAEIEQIRSVAFCCISTGVFGYPIAEAAKTAYATVCNWLKHHPDALDLVVFNVFSERDYGVYAELMK